MTDGVCNLSCYEPPIPLFVFSYTPSACFLLHCAHLLFRFDPPPPIAGRTKASRPGHCRPLMASHPPPFGRRRWYVQYIFLINTVLICGTLPNHCTLLIFYFLFSIFYFLFSIFYFLFSIFYFLFSIFYFLFSIFYFPIFFSNFFFIWELLRICHSLVRTSLPSNNSG